MDKRNRIYHVIYLLMLAVLVFMMVWASVNNHSESLGEALSKDRIPFDTGWFDADGNEVDMNHLNNYREITPYVDNSIYNVVPSDLKEGQSLCFRSKNIYYKVYVDGKLRYDPVVLDGYIYNDTFGTRWNYVGLLKEDAGKKIEIKYHTVYENARARVDFLCISNATGEVINRFSEKQVSYITSILMIFVGIVLMVADIPINMQSRKNHELLYLGMFSVVVALWCLTETNIIQYFTNDSQILQILACYSLLLIPIPMILYLDASFGYPSKLIVPVFCTMSAVEFLICTVLHFLKIADYHETLKLTHVMVGLSAIILMSTILVNFFSGAASNLKNVYNVLRTIGLACVGITTVIDLVRFYKGNAEDTAMFVRIGMLIFIICYGSSSLERTVNAVKLGIQTEFISKLAYLDGLTEIGNRTAFQERIEELESLKDEVSGIGIIMFDVNDLKAVNDNLGHQMGDEMLVDSANVIKKSVESRNGECFRIGGDEFVVIVSGDNVSEDCKHCLSEFENEIKKFNEENNKPFSLSIASGYALCTGDNKNEKLMDVYEKADVMMYDNKKQMKNVKEIAW